MLGYSTDLACVLRCVSTERCLQLLGKLITGVTGGSPKKNKNWFEHNFTCYFSGQTTTPFVSPPKKRPFLGGPYFGGEFWILRKLHWGGWRPSIPMISCKVANLNKSFERKKSLNGPGGFGGRSWDPNSVCQGPSKGSWNCLSVQGAPWIFKRFC